MTALGAGDRFDIFILSDNRDLRIALDELHAAEWLRKSLFPHMRVYYRRRLDNRHRKAGILPISSPAGGGTTAYDRARCRQHDARGDARHLARAMAADPKAGIIQTVPALHRRNTLSPGLHVSSPVASMGRSSRRDLPPGMPRRQLLGPHNASSAPRRVRRIGGVAELRAASPSRAYS